MHNTNISIAKVASSQAAFRRPFRRFPSARAAFRTLLQAARIEPEDQVLLPGYIGWSAREGSGVFDPVRELGLGYAFYRIDRSLHVDLDSLERCLATGRVKIFVIIHYFGVPDPHYADAVALARRYGALVLEDEAHAMLSDLVGGVSGRLGDAALFSLHKMLPVPDGGMLMVKPGFERLLGAERAAVDTVDDQVPWCFDLRALADARVRNSALLASLVRPLAGELDPLWAEWPDGTVPQTYPVVVRNASRDQLYSSMNEAGYGAVSLYHTMIDELPSGEHSDAHWLSRRIFNLPVHQDATPEQLATMVAELAQQLRTSAKVGA